MLHPGALVIVAVVRQPDEGTERRDDFQADERQHQPRTEQRAQQRGWHQRAQAGRSRHQQAGAGEGAVRAHQDPAVVVALQHRDTRRRIGVDYPGVAVCRNGGLVAFRLHGSTSR